MSYFLALGLLLGTSTLVANSNVVFSKVKVNSAEICATGTKVFDEINYKNPNGKDVKITHSRKTDLCFDEDDRNIELFTNSKVTFKNNTDITTNITLYYSMGRDEPHCHDNIEIEGNRFETYEVQLGPNESLTKEMNTKRGGFVRFYETGSICATSVSFN